MASIVKLMINTPISTIKTIFYAKGKTILWRGYLSRDHTCGSDIACWTVPGVVSVVLLNWKRSFLNYNTCAFSKAQLKSWILFSIRRCPVNSDVEMVHCSEFLILFIAIFQDPGITSILCKCFVFQYSINENVTSNRREVKRKLVQRQEAGPAVGKKGRKVKKVTVLRNKK